MKQHSVNKLKYLTPIEVVELETRLANGKRKEFRNLVMIELLLRTGMRSSEMLLLRPMDLYLETESIQVATIKGGKDREIPIPQVLFKKVKSMATGERDQPIFPIAQRTLQGIWYEIRPVRKKLHSLRHTYAYNLYKRHKDLLLCKRALGHRSINSTMVYQEEYYQQADLNRLLAMND